MSKTRKKYTPEFKREAVKLAEEVGFTKAGFELGTNHDNIRKWSKALQPLANDNPPGSPKPPPHLL